MRKGEYHESMKELYSMISAMYIHRPGHQGEINGTDVW